MNLEAQADVAQLQRLQFAFEMLPVVLQRKIIREETRKAAKTYMLPKLKIEVPKRTGRLRAALAVRAIKRARNRTGVRMALTSAKFKQGKKGTAWRGQIPFYAGFLEYGWRVGKRSRAILAAQRLASRRNYKDDVGIKKDGTLRSATKRALSAAQDAKDKDTRKKIPGNRVMSDAARMYGDITAGMAARGIIARIGEWFRSK